jgi:hypothetical protein
MGFSAADIVQLATNPHYQAFDGLRHFFGDEEIRRRIGAVVARCGVLRMRTIEREDDAAPLVQIEMPA